MFALLLTFTQIARAAQSLWPNLPSSVEQQQTLLEKCSSSGNLKYISGNALTDSPNCLGPNNAPYPSAAVSRTFSSWNPSGSSRRGRMSAPPTLDPKLMQRTLLQAYGDVNENEMIEDVRTRYSKCYNSTQVTLVRRSGFGV